MKPEEPLPSYRDELPTLDEEREDEPILLGEEDIIIDVGDKDIIDVGDEDIIVVSTCATASAAPARLTVPRPTPRAGRSQPK